LGEKLASSNTNFSVQKTSKINMDSNNNSNIEFNFIHYFKANMDFDNTSDIEFNFTKYLSLKSILSNLAISYSYVSTKADSNMDMVGEIESSPAFHNTAFSNMEMEEKIDIISLDFEFKKHLTRIISPENIGINFSVDFQAYEEIVHGIKLQLNSYSFIDTRFIQEFVIKPEIISQSEKNIRFLQHYVIKPEILGDSEIYITPTKGYAIYPEILGQSEWRPPAFEIVPLIEHVDFYEYILSIIPERYREDKDFLIFINLIARELGRLRELISELPEIKDPHHAPKEFLVYLARMIGYDDFRSDLNIEDNRNILSKYIEILRRRASPRIIKSAVKFTGHPEDLVNHYEDYENILLNLIDIGVYEILYDDPDIVPTREHIEKVKQAGVRVFFGFLALAEIVDFQMTPHFHMMIKIILDVDRTTGELRYDLEKVHYIDIIRQPFIWGSPVYELEDVLDSKIKSHLIQQPDFEIEYEDI